MLYDSCMEAIPYATLKIPISFQQRLQAGMSKRERYAHACGMVPMTDDAKIGICFLLIGDHVEKIADAARQTLIDMPCRHVLAAINRDTHSKLLEFLIEFRKPDPELDERVYTFPEMNDRTARLIVQRANELQCEMSANNQMRLLMTPMVLLDLKANPRCPQSLYQRAESFLRTQNSLPEMPQPPPSDDLDGLDGLDSIDGLEALDDLTESDASPMSFEEELDAAIAKKPSLRYANQTSFDMFNLNQFNSSNGSHGLGEFSFNFRDSADEFSFNLTQEREERQDSDEEAGYQSVEMQLKEMTVGQKIKLAYKGNKEVRGVLIRDRNKTVAIAVLKSGRMTDGEVVAAAGNRNLSDDIIREISLHKEYTRRYPVKVALVNNSKTPIKSSISLMKSLHKKDLKALVRNRNVSRVVSRSAKKLFMKKYQQF